LYSPLMANVVDNKMADTRIKEMTEKLTKNNSE
jgi:hypothetical protein